VDGQFVFVIREPGDDSTGNEALQVQVATHVFAQPVKLFADTSAAMLWADRNVGAVVPRTIGDVARNSVITEEFADGMLGVVEVEVHSHPETHANRLGPVENDETALSEYIGETTDLSRAVQIGRVDRRETGQFNGFEIDCPLGVEAYVLKFH
jgi:hypothetical protein